MKQNTEKYYDSWTEKYLNSGYGNIIQAHRPTNVEDLLKYTAQKAGIKNGMKILDAGCGICGPAAYFAENFNVKIDALTISGVQLEYCKELISKKGLENKIKPLKGDFHYLDKLFNDEYFDLIIMLESYGHAHNQKRVLKAAEKVLKKNGKIYIKDYFAKEITGSSERKKAVKKAIKNMNKAYSYNLPNLNQTIKSLRSENLQLLEINKHKLPLDNEKSVMEFERKHNIDIYENGFHYIFLEPLELLFRKPENPDEPIS